MIFLLIILLLLQLLTYLIIRGGTMNKSPEEIEDELNAKSKWLKEQKEKKRKKTWREIMEKTQITKGDMYYADLGTNVGSEQNGTRPVVIIQNDVGNKYAQTAIIVPLTKIITNKVKQPTHCIISPTDNLKHYSVALTEQIRVIDKSRLKTKIGHLNKSQIKDLDKAITIALNLKG